MEISGKIKDGIHYSFVRCSVGGNLFILSVPLNTFDVDENGIRITNTYGTTIVFPPEKNSIKINFMPSKNIIGDIDTVSNNVIDIVDSILVNYRK